PGAVERAGGVPARRRSRGLGDSASGERTGRQEAAVRQLRPAALQDDPGLPAARPSGRADRSALGAAEAYCQGRRTHPLSDRRFLPDQRHLPQQPDDAALLRRAGPRRGLQGGGGVTFYRWAMRNGAAILFLVSILIFVVSFA